MLRNLGKDENVVKFQKLCGLSWDYNNDEPGSSWSTEEEYNSSIGLKNKYNRTGSSSSSSDFSSSDDNEYDKNTLGQNAIKYECNNFIHKLFMFGAELGNELFYITFLPFIFWNVDDYIARRLIMLWVFNMYTGQGLKDILCWPRPKSPPVLRLETNYAAEYGMPSTHAIAGSIIPFGLVYFSYGRFQVESKQKLT